MLKEKFESWFGGIPCEAACAWAGTFGETADGLPFIAPDSDHPRSYAALGYGGNGITFGLVAAEIIRDLCLGKKNRDQRLFRFGR